MTVTSTTVTGAKSLTYEKAATAVAITTGAGADAVVFEAAVSGAGIIATHSGNDSIQFLKSAAFTGGANLVQVPTLFTVLMSSATARSVVVQVKTPS